VIGGGTTAVAALFEDWARGIPALALEVGQHPGRLGPSTHCPHNPISLLYPREPQWARIPELEWGHRLYLRPELAL